MKFFFEIFKSFLKKLFFHWFLLYITTFLPKNQFAIDFLFNYIQNFFKNISLIINLIFVIFTSNIFTKVLCSPDFWPPPRPKILELLLIRGKLCTHGNNKASNLFKNGENLKCLGWVFGLGEPKTLGVIFRMVKFSTNF